jgi:mRNA interferase HicA
MVGDSKTIFNTNKRMAKCGEILRGLLRAGWYVASQTGSHIKLRHPDRKDFIVFPNHPSSEMATGTLRKILKQAGDDYAK